MSTPDRRATQRIFNKSENERWARMRANEPARTVAQDFEHFLTYTANLPADERLRLAYEHGAARGVGDPTPAEINRHLEAVLRASGSGLRFYSMQKTLDDMRSAMRAAITGSAQ